MIIYPYDTTYMTLIVCVFHVINPHNFLRYLMVFVLFKFTAIKLKRTKTKGSPCAKEHILIDVKVAKLNYTNDFEVVKWCEGPPFGA